jgi:hypothetical protein
MGRAGHGGLGLGLVADLPVEDQVAGHVLVHLRRAGLQRLVGERRQAGSSS